MKGDYQFTRLRKERKVTMAGVGKNGLTTFLALGIVNPMGPTLSVLAGDGPAKADSRMRILHLTLNPFCQSCQEVGKVQMGARWEPARDLEPFFSLPFGGCPTLLIPSALYSAVSAHQVFAGLLRVFPDAKSTLKQLRRFPGNPVKRVKAEMKDVVTFLKKLADNTADSEKPGFLTTSEAREFARLQLKEGNLMKEMKVFLTAWAGSIDFCGQADCTMLIGDLLSFLKRISLTARMPSMPSVIDNPDKFASK